MMDAAPRSSPILGLIRMAQAARMPKPALPTFSRTMEPLSGPIDPLRLEIRGCRTRLRALEHRRNSLLVETAALRLWEEAPSEGRVPKWVAEAAIRRRLAEIDELGAEIQAQVDRIAQLCNALPDNPHGTPSLELEPIPISATPVSPPPRPSPPDSATPQPPLPPPPPAPRSIPTPD